MDSGWICAHPQEPPPVWHMGQLNLLYCHSSLQNYPFLLFILSILIYFTLQVCPRATSMAEPYPHPDMMVNGRKSGLCTGVHSTWCPIFVTLGSRERAHPYIILTGVRPIIQSFEPRKRRKTGNYIMLIYFTWQLCHGNNWLHSIWAPRSEDLGAHML